MDFTLAPETDDFRKRIRAFVEKNILPLESDPATYDGHENIRVDLLDGLRDKAKALALELAPHGIRVNALAPGYVETDLTRDYLASDAGKKLLKRIPQRRPAQMEELSGPLLLLASDASSYMTGAVLAVDGGHLVSSL